MADIAAFPIYLYHPCWQLATLFRKPEGVAALAEEQTTWLEGIISVTAALQAGNRPVEHIYLYRAPKRRHERALARLVQAAQAAQVPVSEVDEPFITARAGGSSHGGVLAAVGPRRLVPLADLAPGKPRPFLVMLDGIEDPFNFGQAVRTLYAAGVDGLVLRPRNWLSAAGIVTRASAGATELMPTAVAETAEAAASFFRERGLAIACTSHRQALSLYEADLTGPLFLLLGGEKRGITRSFWQQADLRLAIPYGRETFSQSLGAAAAAAILGFEVMRQRSTGTVKR